MPGAGSFGYLSDVTPIRRLRSPYMWGRGSVTQVVEAYLTLVHKSGCALQHRFGDHARRLDRGSTQQQGTHFASTGNGFPGL
jgi:hypothetical protein